MSLWRSRGIALHGFEIKRYRSDWLRELKDPAKSDPIQRFCHFWWIVAEPAVGVKLEELPDTWGLLVPDKNHTKLVQVRKAPSLTPDTLTTSFVASVLRRAAQQDAVRLRRSHQEGYELGQKNGPSDMSSQIMSLQGDVAALRKMIADFQEASGVEITKWDAGQVGKAVKLLQSRYYQSPERLEMFRKAAEQFSSDLLKTIDDEISIAKQLTEDPHDHESGS